MKILPGCIACSTLLLTAFTKLSAATDTCAALGEECYTNGLECCDPVHDCDEGFCNIRIFLPNHGQSCDDDCGCALLAEGCVDEICQPTGECADLGDACSNEVPCCDPEQDCIVPPELDTSNNFLNNGYCEVAGANTGEACTDDDSCRFDYELCVDNICKVNPSLQEDASAKTTVTVTANAYDERTADMDGCGTTGCLPSLSRDGSLDPESRWSCSKKLGYGTCYIEYAFDEPQDVISMNIAFYKGDERTRTLKVYGDGHKLGEYTSSGTTLEFENWTLNAEGVSLINLVPKGLSNDWLSVTEVQLLDYRYYC